MKAHLEIVYSNPETGEPTSAIFTAVDNLQQLILLRNFVEEMSDYITTILARCRYRMPRPRSVRQAYYAVQAMVRGSGQMGSVSLPHFRCQPTFTTARAALLLTCRDLRNDIEYYSHPKEKLREILPTLTQFLEQSNNRATQ